MEPELEKELKAIPDPERRRQLSEAFDNYLLDLSNYSNRWAVEDIWAVPFVTSHRYSIHFGNFLDFEELTMNLSTLWDKADGTVFFHSRHVDVRE